VRISRSAGSELVTITVEGEIEAVKGAICAAKEKFDSLKQKSITLKKDMLEFLKNQQAKKYVTLGGATRVIRF